MITVNSNKIKIVNDAGEDIGCIIKYIPAGCLNFPDHIDKEVLKLNGLYTANDILDLMELSYY
jgi:hypothetical protein